MPTQPNPPAAAPIQIPAPEAVDRADLAARIAAAALLRGTFTLRSGRTSSYYLDKYRFTSRPELLAPVAALLAEKVGVIERAAGTKAVRLAGAELGGIPLVSATALATGLPAVFVRNQKKDYGTAQRFEGPLEQDDPIVFLEDVATTAGQAVEACRALIDAGARVLGAVAVIDREEGAAETMADAGFRFERLFTKRDLGVTDD
ncbi:MAG: orotate phosphoribosyltransferase [Planctomycetota bacterium]